jgi:hypothetical protein
MESSYNGNIPDEVIKKEARGIDDYSLGEVRQVTSEYVITHKGIVNTKWFQIQSIWHKSLMEINLF